MANDAKRSSQLNVTNSVSYSDRLLVLSNPAGAANLQTIAVNNFISSTITGPYANDSVANTAGIPVKGLYYNSNGTVQIRLT